MRAATAMREFFFWASVLLALPACDGVFGLNRLPPNPTTPDSGFNLVRGSEPRGGVVFCDIELARQCATDLEIARGIPLSEAAVALATGRSSDIALDYSPAALAECNGGPMALNFHGKFPEGLPVCLNCVEVLGPERANPDAAAVCQAQCYDQFLGPEQPDGSALPVTPPTPATVAYCSVRAQPSANALLDACFADACENAGTLKPFFLDPRRTPEPIIWTDRVNADPAGPFGNDLIRSAPTSGQFDAGALSEQWIRRGDAWVEFSAKRGQSQIVGLSEVPMGCDFPCPNTDASHTSINFGILLRYDGSFFVSQGGTIRPGPGLDGSFGPSVEGDRFRVRIRENPDGTASVAYSRLDGSCILGATCNETIFHASTGVAHYPLRVDASLFHETATVTDVRVVRIK